MDSDQLANNVANSSKESFIFDNINDLPIDDRKDILQIIYNSQYRDKLNEKGNGVQIKISDLSQAIIDKIYITIINKLNDQTIDF
jgi:hypothetical protein